ncbi:TetR/AcrR family transcriptional regulator [Conexibacter woesei]|uniref:Transcriptional regulator, TetR family n=1 Tax=Conexibacter woesei (strain DSM 14684 / CCUG 47730 / CIP 108061 / JCM 11494 / NBRC 100937 / ID131577) TaxID=469383 RepID=D3F880_CONWI|nr:TetR/AcrR family transcriptional regulator [Conexibacter woesei]ADB48950.1 transcriptional regulator, TetR family [Conexibacter woesei DSM 14684]
MSSTRQPPGSRRIRGLTADERREQRRRALLDAALELFAARGFGEVSIEQLCQAAYVSTKSFYEQFDSREQCYVALMNEVTAEIKAVMGRAFAAAPDDEAAGSRLLLEAFAGTFATDPRYAKVLFGEGSATSPTVERQRRTNRRWAAGFLAEIWQRYRPGEQVAPGIAIGAVGGLFDIVADWVIDLDPADDDAATTLLERLVAFYFAVRGGL